MDPLVYAAQTLGYILGPSVSQRKGAIIQDINTIQLKLGKGPVDLKQFEMLMQQPLAMLERFINDQSSLLAVPQHHTF